MLQLLYSYIAVMAHPRQAYFPIYSKQKEEINKNTKILQFQSILQKQRNAIKDLLKKHNNGSTASEKQKDMPISQRSLNNTQSEVKTPQLYLEQSIPSTRLSLSIKPYIRQGRQPENNNSVPTCPAIDSEQAKQLQYLKSQQYKNYLKKITQGTTSQKEVLKQMKQTRNHNIYLKKPEFTKKINEEVLTPSARIDYPLKQQIFLRRQKNKERQKAPPIPMLDTNLYHRTNKTQRFNINQDQIKANNQRINFPEAHNSSINNIITPKHSYIYLEQRLQELQKQQIQKPIIKRQKIKVVEASTQTIPTIPTIPNTPTTPTPIKNAQKVIIQSKVIEHYKHDPIIKQDQNKLKIYNENFQFAQKLVHHSHSPNEKLQSRTKLQCKPQTKELNIFTHTAHRQCQISEYKKNPIVFQNTKKATKQKTPKQYNIRSQSSFLKNKFQENKQNYQQSIQYQRYSSSSSDENPYQNKNANIYEVDFKLNPPCKKNYNCQRQAKALQNINLGKKWEKQSQTTSVITKSTEKRRNFFKSASKLKGHSKLSLITPSRLNK